MIAARWRHIDLAKATAIDHSAASYVGAALATYVAPVTATHSLSADGWIARNVVKGF